MTTTQIHLTLPRPHPGQRTVLASRARFRTHACGRRWGKTHVAKNRIVRPALDGFPVGWFAPTYKILDEAWRDLRALLKPVEARANANDRRLELITGGVIEFWSLDDPDAGRSRKYKRVAVDEAAMCRHLESAWTKAIRPTLTDFKGDADFYSTPKGRDYFWKCFVRGRDPLEPEWESFHLPTAGNPFIDPAEIEAARRELPDRVFRQEYLAEFLEDAGGVFRNVTDAIDRGRVEPEPRRQVGAYVLGVDLARLEDFTVLTVADQSGRQVYFERFNTISWERQIASIKRVADLYRAKVYVDATGIGDPLCEQLRKAGVNVEPYTLTNASKNELIDNLAMALERGAVRLMDVPEQEAELAAYQYELTKARNLRTGAPEGMHDDCVIALALAVFGSKSAGVSRGFW